MVFEEKNHLTFKLFILFAKKKNTEHFGSEFFSTDREPDLNLRVALSIILKTNKFGQLGKMLPVKSTLYYISNGPF